MARVIEVQVERVNGVRKVICPSLFVTKDFFRGAGWEDSRLR